MPIYYPSIAIAANIALAVFIVAVGLVIVALVRRKATKKLAWFTSGSFMPMAFLLYAHDYGRVDARVVRETAYGIPIAVGIFFLIAWLGRRRQRGARDVGKQI